jgi:hypothetical protein
MISKAYFDFDTTLTVGQRVVIRWTNCGGAYAMPATITKVNAKSVLAAIDTAVVAHWAGDAIEVYPAGRVIKAPRLSASKEWSNNNCVAPLPASHP